MVFAHLGQVFPTEHGTAARIGGFEPLADPPEVWWEPVIRLLDTLHLGPGALGVLLFFLVSGFVIPFSLDRPGLRNFVVRRVFRLYPTLWVCLGLTTLVLAVQAWTSDAAAPPGGGTFIDNALLLAPYLRSPWIEPVLWSLAVEEMFYLVAALLAWRGLLGRPGAIVAVAVGMIGVAGLTTTAAPGSPLFWLGFNATCVTFILVGVVLNHCYRGRWSQTQSWVTGGLVLGAFYLAMAVGPMSPQAGTYVPTSVLAAVVFLGLFLARDRIPYSVALDRLSSISYPLYLIHGVNGYVVMRAVVGATGNYYVAFAITLAASLLMAVVVHALVEVPTTELGRRLSAARHRDPAEVAGLR